MKNYKVLAKFDNLLRADDLDWSSEYLLLDESKHYLKTVTYNTENIKEINKQEAREWIQTKLRETNSKMIATDYFSETN